LHEQLGMKKLSARWVLRLLTVDHKCDFKTMFEDVIQMNFCVNSYCGRNMDPLLHTRDEGTIKTMNFISSEEGENCKVGKMMATVFLGCTRYNSYRLSSVEANNQWRYSLIGPFQQHFKEKTSPFGSFIKTMHEFIRARHRWPNSTNSASPPSIFARFSPLQLFPVSWRNSLEERDSPPESSSSPKQRFILKDWTNHIIRTTLENHWIKCIELKGDYVEK